MTYTPPDETAGRGVTMVPGGQGVFPSLTVRENLQLAGWLHRKDKDHTREATEKVLDIFPVLRERLDELGGNLSGGQQQMLTLGMAFIEQPRLLMIDELSLGLAPSVVGQLLEIVRELKAAGTTIILVEQSVNVALTVAETAYFMEKGEIRFHGPTAELLERPDVLRSVFLEGAGTHDEAVAGADATVRAPSRPGPRATATRTPPTSASRCGTSRSASAASPRSPTSRSRSPPARSSGFLGPNGAGKTTLFDVISGFTPQDSGMIMIRDTQGDVHDISHSPGADPRQARARSLVPGRPPLPRAHGHRDDRGRARVQRRRARPARRGVAPTGRRGLRSEGRGSGRGAHRADGARGVPGQVRARAVDRQPAHRGPRVHPRPPADRAAARRAVERHRQREAEALGPLLLRIRDSLGASILVIEHDLPLLTSVADRMVAMELGEVIAQGDPSDVVHDPRVVASYLGTDEAAISRSGGRGPSTT